MDTSAALPEGTVAPQPESSSRVNWRGVVLFCVLAFAFTWFCEIGLRALGLPFIAYSVLGMFGPALAALLVRLVRREGFADAGLHLSDGRAGVRRIYLLAYALPLLLLALSVLTALASTLQHWALGENIHALGQQLVTTLQKSGRPVPNNLSADQLGVLQVVSSLLLALTVAVPFNMLATFGEEFGWRGYLLPRLAPLGGTVSALLVSVVWGLWHAPLIVLDGYNYPGHPWLGVLMMTLFTIPLSVIFAWLRFRSGSVWPSTLAHAVINGNAAIVYLLLSSTDSLLRAPIGLLGLVPFYALAIWLIATGRLREV